jgi:hypothetical protein
MFFFPLLHWTFDVFNIHLITLEMAMLKEESFQWQEETLKTLRIFIRLALGQKMFSKEEIQIFFKILKAF